MTDLMTAYAILAAMGAITVALGISAFSSQRRKR